ncbi:MAG: RNA pseudouridine synthase [Treponema sp.]|jgi:23S rRNA pseudouridine1911/1915/1917 synthase|nr:RNA pseudouridine synthase [Treponema sp.]
MSITDRIVELRDDYLALNKIPGESVETLTVPQGSLVDLPLALQRELGDAVPPAAPHRLDVPVSGCVLFARNPRTLAFLGGCFREPGRVEKIYWGIAAPSRNAEDSGSLSLPGVPVPPEVLKPDPQGVPVPPEVLKPGPLGVPIPQEESPWVELVHWLAVGRGNRSLVYDESGPGRKKGVLRYRVLGRGDRYLFLEIRLITGRRHQIRAQLSHTGFSIKGDLKYGARRSEKGGGIRLHCRSLAFPDPAGGERIIRVEAPPPEIDNLWRAFMDAAESRKL